MSKNVTTEAVPAEAAATDAAAQGEQPSQEVLDILEALRDVVDPELIAIPRSRHVRLVTEKFVGVQALVTVIIVPVP